MNVKKVALGSIALTSLLVACTNKPENIIEKEHVKAPQSKEVIVTRENFQYAETIRNAQNYIKLGADNKWVPFRKIAPIGKKAPTVRMNLDTLYSVAVLDNPNGKITVTIPEGDVLRTILVLDEQAYSLYYFQEAGEHEIISKSPFIILIARLGVKDYQNPADIEYAHKLQDGLKVRGQGSKAFNPTKYDKASLEALTKELKKEFLTVGKGQVVQGQFKNDVDEYKRLMTSAAAFGGMHDQINTYNNSPMMDPEKCYATTFIDPKVRDFFSFTMYDEEGYLIDGKTAENSYNMKANADGSYTVHFNCGEEAINNLDSGGHDYNYMVRTYGASTMVKTGKWNPINDTVVVEQ
jgi:hypothetical protein